MQISMFSLAELPANRSASPASEKDWQIRVATSCSPIWQLLTDIAPGGWFGRTSPASCPPGLALSRRVIWKKDKNGKLTKQVISDASSLDWGNSGMGSPTEFLTLSTSEFHSGAVACSLSDILETGDVPQRFFLSATACKGILRRAAKRGKTLPSQLHHALTKAANIERPKEITLSPTPSQPATPGQAA
jgi:hypothetical protein